MNAGDSGTAPDVGAVSEKTRIDLGLTYSLFLDAVIAFALPASRTLTG